MLFAKPGVYEPSGIFSIDHFKLMIITIIGIIIALKKTIKKSKEEVYQIIKRCTIIIWFLEIIVISFKIKTGGIRFVSIHSFLYHGIMVYLGILINVTNYITIQGSDIKYYASLVGCVCGLAYIINSIFDSNLMFISKEFSVVAFLYKISGPYYPFVASIGQMTLPFYTIYAILRLKKFNKVKI